MNRYLAIIFANNQY